MSPTAADNQGRLLSDCHLVLIWWGAAWGDGSAPPITPTRQQCFAALSEIVYGAWGTQLGQYRGIGPFSIAETWVDLISSPKAQFTDSDIVDEIQQQISDNAVPSPGTAPDMLYVVLLPPGVESQDHASDH